MHQNSVNIGCYKLNLTHWYYFYAPERSLFLACLFQKKKLIGRSSSFLLLLSCKNFNAAHYSKGIKSIITKLGILVHHDKMQLQDKGHDSEHYSFGVKPLTDQHWYII